MVVDNFFPKKLIDLVLEESEQYEWLFIRTDSNQDLYWTKVIYGDHFNFSEKIPKIEKVFTSENARECWEFFKRKADCDLTDDNLESFYFNGLTHGLEAHAHIDAKTNDYVTVICYVCSGWNSHWGGETVFFSGEMSHNPADEVFYTHDIVSTVLPRHNRIVLFPSNQVHAVRPISKSFKGLRKTMMFKIKNRQIEDFSKLCNLKTETFAL